MKAKIKISRDFKIGDIDGRLYGSFIEHLGRAVYSGIYEPGHPEADSDGFRRDVIELVKRIGVPIVRYPGGNFVSGYNWEDGTGDRAERPRRIEAAWSTIETNEVGIDEFQRWATLAGSEIMMAVNLGTRGIDAAKNLLEYCNLSTDTHYANMRRRNGFEKPFGIKTWCLGNEMDGPWQIGRRTADDYGKLAAATARVMKSVDPSIELVACGSSNYNMKTFGDWELTVLEHAYEEIDYISLHQYYWKGSHGSASLIGKSVEMNDFIKGVAAICDAVKTKKHSKKTLNLSFDEWNVWYHSNGVKHERWQVAPPQLEDIYTFEDALLVGCILMTLQNNCDRVKIACLAQLVNVIAPIMTERGGKAWVQTIFYPYSYASVYGRGSAMRQILTSDTYETEYSRAVPYLESSVILNEEKRTLTVFAVNRSLLEDMELELELVGYGSARAVRHTELYSDDLLAVNSPDEQTVSPCEREVSDAIGEAHTVRLRKHSWNMIAFEY